MKTIKAVLILALFVAGWYVYPWLVMLKALALFGIIAFAIIYTVVTLLLGYCFRLLSFVFGRLGNRMLLGRYVK